MAWKSQVSSFALIFFLSISLLQNYCISVDRWEHVKGGKKEEFEGDLTSNPGSRFLSSHCQRNQDSSDLFLFGGYGYIGGSKTHKVLGQLWKFSVTTKSWTLLHNPPVDDNVVGDYGVYNVSYHPSGRVSATCFLRKNLLFIFAGDSKHLDYETKGRSDPVYQQLPHNDVWAYNFTNSQWTILSGNKVGGLDVGDYTKDVTSRPHNRYFPFQWDTYGDETSDSNHGVYIYGGVAKNIIHVMMDDMLKYNFTGNNWKILRKFDGSYNKQPLNNKTGSFPGSVADGATWVQTKNFKTSTPEIRLYLHGGAVYESGAYVRSNQVLVYSTKENTWEVKIPHNTNASNFGFYYKSEYSQKNLFPRKGELIAFGDPNLPYVYMFGGLGGNIGKGVKTYYYNDLWVYEYYLKFKYFFVNGYHYGDPSSVKNAVFPPKEETHHPAAISGYSGWMVKQQVSNHAQKRIVIYLFGGKYDTKWYGDLWRYEIYECAGKYYSYFEDECSRHGECLSNGECSCESDYAGNECENEITGWLAFQMLMESFGYTENAVDGLKWFGFCLIPLIPVFFCCFWCYCFKECCSCLFKTGATVKKSKLL